MTPSRLLLIAAVLAVVAALIALVNPFGSEVEADTRALTFALEQFVGSSFAVVGGLVAAVGYYRAQPLKWQMMTIGGVTAVIGLLVLFDPGLTLTLIGVLVPVQVIVSGAMKLNIGRRQLPTRAGWWIIGAGAVSIVVGLLGLINLADITAIEIGTLLAVQMLATGVMLSALAVEDRAKT